MQTFPRNRLSPFRCLLGGFESTNLQVVRQLASAFFLEHRCIVVRKKRPPLSRPAGQSQKKIRQKPALACTFVCHWNFHAAGTNVQSARNTVRQPADYTGRLRAYVQQSRVVPLTWIGTTMITYP
jgi:hypothetical protein